MKKEVRTVCYDEDLKIEAYRFEGIDQPFPNHFHDHYTIGCMVSGERYPYCRNKEYLLKKGHLVLFNPGDNHSCIQNGSGTLYYRGLNISKETMAGLAKETTGKEELAGLLISESKLPFGKRRSADGLGE